MTETTYKLQQALDTGREYILNTSEIELSYKISEEKWSKKEILGHLIDSAINNLQRFTEVQFCSQPYPIRKYDQNALVKANNYQNTDTKEIIEFWYAINQRILSLIKNQTKESLNYTIELEKDKFSDLRFLMTDYVIHLEHHLQQIMK